VVGFTLILLQPGTPAWAQACDPDVLFSSASSLDAVEEPRGLAIGDFNDDGTPDLAISNGASEDLRILLGNGDGTFQPQPPIDEVVDPSWIEIADLDNDDVIDLAVVNDDGHVTIYRGVGDGTFHAPTAVEVDEWTTILVADDYNLDGNVDLAAYGQVTGWGLCHSPCWPWGPHCCTFPIGHVLSPARS
jgi:hypothetical protein